MISQQQKEILETWLQTENNLLINSGAGSGKTTTIFLLLKNLQEKSLIVAFNKSIQEEIEAKLKMNSMFHGKAMTLHSLGLKTCRKFVRNLKIKSNKNWLIIDKLQELQEDLIKTISKRDIYPIYFSLIEMNDTSRIFFIDDFEDILSKMHEMGKFYANHPKLKELWGYFKEYRDASYEIDRPFIDFIDMIYLPVKYKLEIPVDPKILYIDEAQDLNMIQHLFINQLISQGDVSKWAAVGDHNQSIYAFAGSLPNSFNLFKNYENVVEKELNTCYRCPPNIVREANKVYNTLIPFKEEEGKIGNVFKAEEIKEGSMVICRNSAPLISLYFELLREGKSCYINGSDMLPQIKRFLAPYKNYSIMEATNALKREEMILENPQNENERIQKYLFQQNFENFIALVDKRPPNLYIRDLLKSLDEIFETKEDSIMLCTIHKSKGLEAKVVYILNEDLIPSRFAKTRDQLIQEKNLQYVARTRATEEMYYLKL